MGGRQIEHSYSKVGQSVGSMKSACVCVYVCVLACGTIVSVPVL